jgi:RNA-directed DNA polymerase
MESILNEEKQMTGIMVKHKPGASSASATWDAINWQTVQVQVKRLQMRIAKATREGRWNKVKALQRLLTSSYYAKLLAVKRVTANRGGKTPGIDNIIWRTSKQKMEAALSLRKRGYHTKPLKRIYIPKKNKKLRPLSIPVFSCRAMQMLHLLALEPVVEMMADKNSYGFRPKRSAADAIEQCFVCLAQRVSAHFVLEGDIEACFDSISQPWMLENIVMDKVMLKKWFDAGYIDKGTLYQMERGTVQGSPISPTMLNATMSGLQQAIKAVSKPKDKVNVIVYADDFIITGATAELLENRIKPAVQAFLSERGLNLSPEKTKITHIQDGFDFLGFNVRKYDQKLLIKPSKESIKRFLRDIREAIKSSSNVKTEDLIRILNPKLRGWGNYFRHVVSKATFSYIDHNIFKALWQWAKRRHPDKNAQWIKKKYFRSQNLRNWTFYAKTQSKEKQLLSLDLFRMGSITIKRHVKIRSLATPYDSSFKEYFKERGIKRFKVEELGQ